MLEVGARVICLFGGIQEVSERSNKRPTADTCPLLSPHYCHISLIIMQEEYEGVIDEVYFEQGNEDQLR